MVEMLHIFSEKHSALVVIFNIHSLQNVILDGI